MEMKCIDRKHLLKEAQRTLDEYDSEAMFCLCQRWILKDAITLLQKQEPQNVVVKCEPSNGNILWFANCPKCGQGIERDKHKNYCGYCGRAVKWNA